MQDKIAEIISGLGPNLRKVIQTADNVPKIKFVETPSSGLNRSLNGGLPLGRQVLIWGNKSSGKSALCLQTVGKAQKQGLTCAWIDAEMSFDADWAEKLGVDPSSLIYSQARTINDMVDLGCNLMEAGVDVIVVDSISALLPAIYFEKDSDELKQLENTKQIGAESRDFSNAWKMLNYANNRIKPTLLIIISQSRNNIGGLYATQIPQGGNATKFYSSIIVQLFSSESDNQAIKGKIAVGDKLIEEKVGRKVRWDIKFSKISPAFQTGEYDFYFRGNSVGIDSVADLVDTAIGIGIISRTGAWYQVGEERLQGRDAVIEYVKANEKFYNELKEKVLCA